MFNLMGFSFEQSTLAVFGVSWNSFDVKFGVVVSVGTIIGVLYKLWKEAYISVLARKLRDIAFPRIMRKSLLEFLKTDTPLEQDLNAISNAIKNNQFTSDMFVSLINSFEDYKNATDLLIKDLENFFKVYTHLNRYAPQRITMMFDDDVKKLLSLVCNFTGDYLECKKNLIHLRNSHNLSKYDQLIKEINEIRNNVIDHLQGMNPLFWIILEKMRITLNIKQKEI